MRCMFPNAVDVVGGCSAYSLLQTYSQRSNTDMYDLEIHRTPLGLTSTYFLAVSLQSMDGSAAGLRGRNAILDDLFLGSCSRAGEYDRGVMQLNRHLSMSGPSKLVCCPQGLTDGIS